MSVSRLKDLRGALDNGEIVPYFQPIVDLKARQLRGFEVLARRIHPRDGVSLPLDMIRLAEGSGLIGRITEALFPPMAALARSLPNYLRFAVNISPVQFCEASFPETLGALAQAAGFNPSQLTIEITESALLDNFELALQVSEQLKSFGTHLALDDFGTGYSSLRRLQALPFDELKIDASFVRSMSEQRESRKIVAAIVGLSHSLGLTTVAEGIETEEHAEMLFYLGCGRGQGWLFGRPMPASAVPDYLASLPAAEPAGAWPVSNLPNLSNIATTIGSTLEVLPSQRLSQLQAIYEGAAVGLCFLDRDLRYISLNKPFAEAHGRTVEKHLGRTVMEVLPHIYPEVAPYLKRALQGEAIRNLEVNRQDYTQPGQQKTYLVSYQPARDEVGEIVGISIVAVDITERKRAETALRASIDHYWRAAGSGPQVPWTADPTGEIVDISPRWEIVTGLTYADAINGRWKQAIHPGDRDRIAFWWEKAIATATCMDMLCRLRRQDGEWIWIRVTAAPRFGPDGQVIRWYGTLEEIDGRKEEKRSLIMKAPVAAPQTKRAVSR